jgi:fluoride exporter
MNGRDSLERQQSGLRERQRRESEGGEGDLTELAMPDPIDRSYMRKESLELEQWKARENRRSGQSEGCEGFLSEVVAPAPVDDETRSRYGDAEQDSGSTSPSFGSGEEKAAGRLSPVSATATHLYTISYLIVFSILGTLARLGVEAISRYPQAPFPSVVLWANLGGSLFMGFLAEDRRIFRQEWGTHSENWSFHHISKSVGSSPDAEVVRTAHANHGKVKKTIPLYVGLATGFCGSFTSFSSFIRDAFLALTNDLASPSTTSPFRTTPHPAPRNGGYSFEATLAILIIQPTCSIGALYFGAHLALLTDSITPTLPFTRIRRILDPLTVFLAFGCWLGAILLSIFPPRNFWRGRATLPLVFAPPGCLLRFYVSKHLNARIPSFPLGTFSVNIVGTAILGMCYNLQHGQSIGAGPRGKTAACQVLQGIMEGFCGCTTTVSTWVAELTSLRRGHAYIYGMASMGSALALLVVVMGSLGWTSGFGTPICSV